MTQKHPKNMSFSEIEKEIKSAKTARANAKSLDERIKIGDRLDALLTEKSKILKEEIFRRLK